MYTIGFGLDVVVFKQMSIGLGYRYGSLGKYDLGAGVLDTGAGGNVFSLPALQSINFFTHQGLIQLTYLF